jgi:hypothetical protein
LRLAQEGLSDEEVAWKLTDRIVGWARMAVKCSRHMVAARLTIGGRERVIDTRDVVRVLETSHPPVYYVPREDVADGVLDTTYGISSFGEDEAGELARPDGRVLPAARRPGSGDDAAAWLSVHAGRGLR